MRAIVFDAPGDERVLRVGEVPAPGPLHPGELRVRVHATAVNRADLLQRRGLYPPPPGASPILGLECAGEIIEVGAGATAWRIGDRAMALLPGGGYAEEVVVDAGSAIPVPNALSWDEAAAVPETHLTAFLNLFMIGGAGAGALALVHGGSGGVGTAAIALAREAGVRVFVTAGREDRCHRCLALGAALAINYRTQDFVAEVQAATSGAGVDLVLDPIGAPYLTRNLACLATGGRLVIIGLMGGARAEIDLARLLSARQAVVGSTLRARPVAEKAEITRRFQEHFGDALRSGRLRPVVDRVLPLEEAAEAHRAMLAGEHFGKLVLRVAP